MAGLQKTHGIVSLGEIAADFAAALVQADHRHPQATNLRSGQRFQLGIGPHTEAQTVELVMRELREAEPVRYGAYSLSVPYPSSTRLRCDLCLGLGPDWDWAIEVKMLRFFGDNGKLNDNILMHILSPYPEHRSALTDCEKLLGSGLQGRKAILIYGFDHDEWKLDPAIDGFETLAQARVRLGTREVASFGGLVHPVHCEGRVFAWELQSP